MTANGKWTFYIRQLGSKGYCGTITTPDTRSTLGGGLVEQQGYKPSQSGALIYLNGGEDLALPLSKVETAGGKIVVPKKSIGQNGFMAMFTDTEGDKIVFRSMK